jgi:hypothetical protein
MYDGDKGNIRSNNLVARLVCIRENVPPLPNSIVVIKFPPQGWVSPWPFMKPSQFQCAAVERTFGVCVIEKRSREGIEAN